MMMMMKMSISIMMAKSLETLYDDDDGRKGSVL